MLKDRDEAARLLASRLKAWKGKHPLILAIPRGAVPMGAILADTLEGDLDVVLVRKLGAPDNPEYALGAIDESGTVHITDQYAWDSLSPETSKALIERELATLGKRRASYTPVRPPLDPKDRVVIVVDDGVATGATVMAALTAIRRRHPARLILAIGVAPPHTLERLRSLVDELVCLEAPSDFWAVGQFYLSFDQVEDEEVEAILQRFAGKTKGQ
ncbi:MAG: phosphoribosyltransferase family protein [Pseudomonadota bacterium]